MAHATVQVNGRREFSAYGARVEVLASKEETCGAHSLIRCELPAGMLGAPPHFHKYVTEAFYILKGELTVQQGEARSVVGHGELALIQPRTIHSFRNDSGLPVEFLIFATPGGLDELFDGIFDLIGEAGWPPQDRAALIELGKRHDTYYC